MSYYDKYYELVMQFVNFIVNDTNYFVAKKPVHNSNWRKERGYRSENFPTYEYLKKQNANELSSLQGDDAIKYDHELKRIARIVPTLRFNFEFTVVSEDEINTHVERWALTNSDKDFNVDEEEMLGILQDYADDFVGHFFVFEDPDYSDDVSIHDGYSPEIKSENKQLNCGFSVRFSAIQPTRDDFAKQILFFLTTQLK